MGIQRLKFTEMYNSIVNNFDQKKGCLERLQSRYNEAFFVMTRPKVNACHR